MSALQAENLPQRRTATEVEGEWSNVESRSSRKNKKRKLQQNSGDSPTIRFLDNSPARVQLKALQDLVLYVLADGVAPSWLAVNNSKQIDKVVVLMIPGLDRALLENSDALDGALARGNGNGNGNETNMGDGKGETSRAGSGALEQPTASTALSTGINPELEDADSPPLTKRLFEHIIDVKAPGDSSMNKVHSPLRGMLIAPFPVTKKKEMSTEEKAFQPISTPIINFVHSADDLREAEYPVHPAAFTDPRDAQREKERRETTDQSISSGWVDTDVSVSEPCVPAATRTHDPLTQGLQPYGLDCEMVVTEDDKFSLARISLVDWHGKTIIDKYVKPSLPIKNYNTQYSGITPELLENVTTGLPDIQRELLGLLGPDAILLGHSLESDLNALKLTHPFVVDTSIIYPHVRGLPLRSPLRFLTSRYLKREIQKGGANGHDSVEDALAVLDLVRLKCEKGPRWGTLDAHGESIFRRIARSSRLDGSGKARETAIVEYGTPEKGLGKDATYKIACCSDEEVVTGVLRAANGDDTSSTARPDDETEQTRTDGQRLGEPIPPGGVDFVWGRLRDLETARGWNTITAPPPPPLATADIGSSATDAQPPPSASTTPTPAPSTTTTTSADVNETAKRTLSHLHTLFIGLPPRTLLVMYSGTADMRPVLQLQQLHAQYRKEFKVKKWDELSVKWTDVEEQKLKVAVGNARCGVGIIAVR